VRRGQKTSSSPTSSNDGSFRRGQNNAFVAAEVLTVYTRSPDPLRSFVCLDESSKQLMKKTPPEPPMAPGQQERPDYEYKSSLVIHSSISDKRSLNPTVLQVRQQSPTSRTVYFAKFPASSKRKNRPNWEDGRTWSPYPPSCWVIASLEQKACQIF
jgi:hypothetical protein